MNNCIYNFATVAFLVVKHGGKAIYEHKKGFSSEEISKNVQNFGKEAIERFKINVRVYGLENLVEGPAIMCPSHTSIIDMPSIACSIPGRKYFGAKKELFWIPILRPGLIATGMPKIDRSNREKATKSLNEAAEMIKRESYKRKKENTAYLMIYPEGTRTRDPNYGLLPFKKGAFFLSLDSGLPIIPISSFGGLDLMPKGTLKFPKGKDRNYYLMVHSPVFPENFETPEEMLEATKFEMELGIKFLREVSRKS